MSAHFRWECTDPALTALVTAPQYKTKLERVFRLRLETFDWNCLRPVTPRFTEPDIAEAVRPMRERLAQLEAENAELRAGQDGPGPVVAT
jgi:hypothetical protein